MKNLNKRAFLIINMVYTEEELMEELKRVSEEHCNGESPTCQDMNGYGEVTSNAFSYRFGSWNDALRKFGFNANLKHRDKKEILQEVKRISEEHFNGGSYTRREFDKNSCMASDTVNRQIGSWNKALQECGLGPIVEKNIERQRLIEEIQRVSEECCGGDTPRGDDILEHGKFSLDCYHRRGWEGLLNEAGFEMLTPKEYLPTGEDHHSWKGGSEINHYGPSWYASRKKVRGRDDGVCQVCGTEQFHRKNPDIHHITPERYWEDEEHRKMNHPRNLVSLCKLCHRNLEGKFKGRNYEEFKRLAKEELGITDEVSEQRSMFDY